MGITHSLFYSENMSMNIVSKLPVKTKTGTPVTLAEAKAQLRIESVFTADDTLVQSLIAAAIDRVEQDTNSDVLVTDNVLTFEPENGFQNYTIYQSPYKAFTKLEINISGTWADAADTTFKIEYGFSKIELTMLAAVNADLIRLTYKTGYADADIPKVLKQAILLKVADLYDSERSGYTLNVQANRAYEALISKHIRTYWG